MRRNHRRAYGPLIACIASVTLLPVGAVTRAQERTAQSIVDGVVNAVSQKQIVRLGELPTHGEAHTFDLKYDVRTPFDGREHLRLQQCARNAADAAATNRSLDAADRVMLESFARYADRQRPGVTSGRDDSMYRNLVRYLRRLPKDARVAIWTATLHAARRRGSLSEVPLGARGAMGRSSRRRRIYRLCASWPWHPQ